MYAHWGQQIHSQKKINYRQKCQDEKTGMNWY